MSAKDYRELQLTSTQLALIFIAILALGVIIFLLGVSVGKKQATLQAQQLAEASVPTQEITPPAVHIPEQPSTKSSPEKKEKTTPPKTLTTSPKQETVSEKITTKTSSKKTPVTPSRRQSASPVSSKARYYIQVGAYSNRNSARIIAEKLKAQGYPVVIINPLPTERRPLYRVRVGGYSTREEANQVKTKLAQAEGKKQTDYFIVRD